MLQEISHGSQLQDVLTGSQLLTSHTSGAHAGVMREGDSWDSSLSNSTAASGSPTPTLTPVPTLAQMTAPTSAIPGEPPTARTARAGQPQPLTGQSVVNGAVLRALRLPGRKGGEPKGPGPAAPLTSTHTAAGGFDGYEAVAEVGALPVASAAAAADKQLHVEQLNNSSGSSVGGNTLASGSQATSTTPARAPRSRVWDYVAMPLLLPVMAAWWVAAFGIAWLMTFLVIPSWLLARRLYWACPFAPHIFAHMGPVRGWALRIGFEASYCINVITRMLTLPMRPHLPDFYIVGFPKAGTTSLAEHLRAHPALSGPVGLPYHEALAKETHFFEGVLGRDCAHGARLYRSFFPTHMTRWWAEVVRGVPKWACFDACPVHACLPYVAQRIAAVTPHAKIIIMLRDPLKGVFSGEVMLRDMGVPLGWRSLCEPVTGPSDERFQPPPKEERELWDTISRLGPTDTLPADMPHALYLTLGGVLRCGQYAELLQPYLSHFPPENILVVNMPDFVREQEAVVREVLRFVGVDDGTSDTAPPPGGSSSGSGSSGNGSSGNGSSSGSSGSSRRGARYVYKPLPPSMQNAYAGRTMHPSVAERLRALYRPGVRRLQALLQRDMGWGLDDPEV